MTREERESEMCREALRRHWEIEARRAFEADLLERVAALEAMLNKNAPDSRGTGARINRRGPEATSLPQA